MAKDYEIIITDTIEEKHSEQILNGGWYNGNVYGDAAIEYENDPLVLIDKIYAPYTHCDGYDEAYQITLVEMNAALSQPSIDDSIQIISHLNIGTVLGRLFRRRPTKCLTEIKTAIDKIDKAVESVIENHIAAFLNQQKLSED